VRATESAMSALDRGFFHVRLDRLTPRERDYLSAMAELGPGPHRSGDVARAMGWCTARSTVTPRSRFHVRRVHEALDAGLEAGSGEGETRSSLTELPRPSPYLQFRPTLSAIGLDSSLKYWLATRYQDNESIRLANRF